MQKFLTWILQQDGAGQKAKSSRLGWLPLDIVQQIFLDTIFDAATK